jgi:hypothetical protein
MQMRKARKRYPPAEYDHCTGSGLPERKPRSIEENRRGVLGGGD